MPRHFLLLLTGAYASSFLIHLLILTQSVRLPVVTYPSLCSTCVDYRTPCHAIGHQVLPTHPYLFREAEDFPEVATILSMYLCPIFNSLRLIFNHVKKILLVVTSLIKSGSLDM